MAEVPVESPFRDLPAGAAKPDVEAGDAREPNPFAAPAAQRQTCSCDVEIVVMVVRVGAAITHLGTAAAGCWGFLLATDRMNDPRVDLGYGLNNERLGIFTGLMAVLFVLASLLGFLAEVRGPWLLRRVLRPFGFLHVHVGRGVWCLLLAALFAFVPWDEGRLYVSILPAAAQFACGVSEVCLGICARKAAAFSDGIFRTRGPVTGGAGERVVADPHGNPWLAPAGPAPGEEGSSESAEAPASPRHGAAFRPAEPATPADSAAVLVRSGDADGSGSTRIVTNPFLAASGGGGA